MTAIAGLDTGRSRRRRRSRSSRRPRTTGLLVEGSGSGTDTIRRPATRRSTSRPRPRSAATSGSRWRARDRRRRPRRPGGPAGLRRAAPVRPADGRQPGDGRRRVGAGRLQRRRRARVGVVRPGRDVRHAAPDGARRVDRRERRRADAPAPGQRPDRRGPRHAHDRALDVWRRVIAAADAQAVQTAMQAAVEGDLGQAVHRRGGQGAAASRPPASPGTAELGGDRASRTPGSSASRRSRTRRSRSPCSSSRAAAAASAPRRSPGSLLPALLRPVRCSLMTGPARSRDDRPRPDDRAHRPALIAARAGVAVRRGLGGLVRRRRAVPRRDGRDRLPDGHLGRRADPVQGLNEIDSARSS